MTQTGAMLGTNSPSRLYRFGLQVRARAFRLLARVERRWWLPGVREEHVVARSRVLR